VRNDEIAFGDALQADDAEIRHLMTEVPHLILPLSILLQEPLRSRVLGRVAHGNAIQAHWTIRGRWAHSVA
jgi:hypothetical protein